MDVILASGRSASTVRFVKENSPGSVLSALAAVPVSMTVPAVMLTTPKSLDASCPSSTVYVPVNLVLSDVLRVMGTTWLLLSVTLKVAAPLLAFTASLAVAVTLSVPPMPSAALL